MIRRVFSSLPWVLLAQVRGQCPSWSDEGLVELGGKPFNEWCLVNNDDEAACVKSFVLLGSGAYAKCQYDRQNPGGPSKSIKRGMLVVSSVSNQESISISLCIIITNQH